LATADIDSTTLEIRPGYFCSIPKYIILNVKLEQVTYIPREFAGDDCLSALAREHEAKHAEAQEVAVIKLHPALLSALRTMAHDNSRNSQPSGTEALAAFTKETQSIIEQVLDQIDAERARLNAAVDTPDELERLRHACDGRAIQK
jgi:hypothetical protein